MFSDDVAKMKAQIRTAVRDAINEFATKNGVAPSGIRINMADTGTVGRPADYILNDVTVEFKL